MNISISSTYDDRYLFFLPIVSWAWNILGCDVICFMPEPKDSKELSKLELIKKFFLENGIDCSIHFFKCEEDKKATYSQCSRLYAACIDLPEESELMMSDIDMMVFNLSYFLNEQKDGFTIFGADLVPLNQYPICYIKAKVKEWKKTFDLEGKTYQECLDNLLGDIQCENMRGNYWGKDQEESYNKISITNPALINRTNGTTPFATRRLDRDDSYILDRLNLDIIDYHMNRPGYEDFNFEIITKIIQFFNPKHDTNWIKEYKNQYINLI